MVVQDVQLPQLSVRKSSESLKEDCRALYKSTSEAAEMAKATKPEVLFLNTPHGMCLTNSHCVYMNSKAKGNTEWNGQWTEYDVSVDLDSEMARSFLDHLQKDGVAAEGVNAFSACEAPLCWGEVIPVWFFKDLTAAGVKVVIFSNPLKRKDPILLSEVARVGQSIATFLSGLEQRVLYVVSSDLAHSHKTDCTLPLYLPDPRRNMPTSDTALPFDACIDNWIMCTPYSLESKNTPLKVKEKQSCVWECVSAQKWLTEALELKNTALSCGIYGFGILHGMLAAEIEGKAIFRAYLLCRVAPTYYGMVVAAFLNN